MVAGMLAGWGSGVGFYFSSRPSRRVRVYSLLRFEEASYPPVSEALRTGFEAFETRSADLLVVPEIDFPFAMPPLSVAMFLPAVFGLARILHFAVLSNCQLSGNHSQSAPERPWEVR